MVKKFGRYFKKKIDNYEWPLRMACYMWSSISDLLRDEFNELIHSLLPW